jgi:UDP-glucose 4-epimerase
MYATYSLTKSLVEDFCFMYNKYRDTKINMVRAVNAYGPRQIPAVPFAESKVRKITPAFICRALTGQDVEVYGDGTQISDMVYVADVAKALVGALEKAAEGEIFDTVVEVGPKQNYTVNEVAQLVIDICKNRGAEDVAIKHLPMRAGETPNAVVKADYSTLHLVDMNEEELVPLDIGMRKTVEYYIDNKGTTWESPNLT